MCCAVWHSMCKCSGWLCDVYQNRFIYVLNGPLMAAGERLFPVLRFLTSNDLFVRMLQNDTTTVNVIALLKTERASVRWKNNYIMFHIKIYYRYYTWTRCKGTHHWMHVGSGDGAQGVIRVCYLLKHRLLYGTRHSRGVQFGVYRGSARMCMWKQMVFMISCKWLEKMLYCRLYILVRK